MSTASFSTSHLNYLQRIGFKPEPLNSQAPLTRSPLELRRLWRIRSINRDGKAGQYIPGQTSNRADSCGQSPYSGISQSTAPRAEPALLPTSDVLIGLYGYRIPMVFLVRGTSEGITLNLGVWSSAKEKASTAVLNTRQEILKTILDSLYPGIEVVAAEAEISKLPKSGLALGIPGVKAVSQILGDLPIDRLIRAMSGAVWAALILAEPVDESIVGDMRDRVINEIREVEAGQSALKAPSPLAQKYHELLGTCLDNLTRCAAMGGWRTAVYLLGDNLSYYRLASVWRSIFSGEQSIIEPVRVWDNSDAGHLAANWAMPDILGPPGPGSFKHAFYYQTLLDAQQLATYVHLPSLEMPGYFVRHSAIFDVSSHIPEGPGSITVGSILERGRPIGNRYMITPESLQKHTLIVGVTGSGKTNTSFHLLTQLWRQGIPFLVLEPAKTEYRALCAHDQIGPEVRVFTIGEEQVSPLRINPFEVEPGTAVSTHIDLLKSVFNASFGMWNPLPQVLERCLHEIYRDRGWDPSRNVNLRLEAGTSPGTITSPEAFPTLTDLYEKIEEVVERLGYEERVKSDLKAALMTRINSLRIGSKGIMLDTHRSLPMAELLVKPTIIELEQIGDDDEKAFLMGLLMMRIYEHLRGQGSTEGTALKHIVVIEEAHRLLANVPMQTNQEQSNVRGKAVETFTNMLSEVRAYGEGFIVAEQIAVKLSPDVIKNTNLKIVHRTVAGEDRLILSQSMNMDDPQTEMLAVLKKGEAAVFTEGDDKPIMVVVPYAKVVVPSDMKTRAGSDKRIAQHMLAFRNRSEIGPIFVPFEACSQVCQGSLRYCDDAKLVVSNGEFQERFAAFILSTAVTGVINEAEFTALLRHVRSRLPQRSLNIDAFSCIVLNATRWYFDYFGRLYSWSYEDIGDLKHNLIEALLSSLPGKVRPAESAAPVKKALEEFQKLYRRMCLRLEDPFSRCPEICSSGECLFRYHNERLFGDGRLNQLFDQGMAAAVRKQNWPDTSAIAQAVARLNGYDMSESVQRSLGLCYGMLQISYKPGMLEAARELALRRLFGH